MKKENNIWFAYRKVKPPKKKYTMGMIFVPPELVGKDVKIIVVSKNEKKKLVRTLRLKQKELHKTFKKLEWLKEEHKRIEDSLKLIYEKYIKPKSLGG